MQKNLLTPLCDFLIAGWQRHKFQTCVVKDSSSHYEMDVEKSDVMSKILQNLPITRMPMSGSDHVTIET